MFSSRLPRRHAWPAMLAAARELESRGYRPSPTPDLLLDFNGKLEERTDIESTPSAMYGPGWVYGGWYGAPWGGGQELRRRHYKVCVRALLPGERGLVHQVVIDDLEHDHSRAGLAGVSAETSTWPTQSAGHSPTADYFFSVYSAEQ